MEIAETAWKQAYFSKRRVVCHHRAGTTGVGNAPIFAMQCTQCLQYGGRKYVGGARRGDHGNADVLTARELGGQLVALADIGVVVAQ